jgi:hypothetical protein
MEKQAIKEFIEKDGTLINSKMKPNLNRQAMSKQTTDQHVSAARQGMVWMNYRRFYGEAGEVLPFVKEADKWEKNPEAFYKFLKTKGKTSDFNKYFVKKEDGVEKTNVTKVLKEAQRNKMQTLIEDLLTKKRENIELVKNNSKDKNTITDLRKKNPEVFKLINEVIKKITDEFTDSDDKDVIVDYITQKIL